MTMNKLTIEVVFFFSFKGSYLLNGASWKQKSWHIQYYYYIYTCIQTVMRLHRLHTVLRTKQSLGTLICFFFHLELLIYQVECRNVVDVVNNKLYVLFYEILYRHFMKSLSHFITSFPVKHRLLLYYVKLKITYTHNTLAHLEILIRLITVQYILPSPILHQGHLK